MKGETNVDVLIKTCNPLHNKGDYVFCTTTNEVNIEEIIMVFKEVEGNTIILKKETADALHLSYSFVAAWITLTIHSSLEAVGFTAAFSSALSKENISCNVVAAFYHDHIFVNKKDVKKAMKVLKRISS
jgi:hypothetical protein